MKTEKEDKMKFWKEQLERKQKQRKQRALEDMIIIQNQNK